MILILIELRNRNIESRLLDRRRIDEEKTNWQWFNLLTPLAILGLLGGIFFWLRKKKFGRVRQITQIFTAFFHTKSQRFLRNARRVFFYNN